MGADGICGLKLKGCGELQMSGVMDWMCKYLQKLRVLDVADCPGVAKAVPDVLLRSCNKITDVDVSSAQCLPMLPEDIADIKLVNAAAACRRLECLKMTVSSDVEHAFVNALSQVDGMKLQTLEVLDVQLGAILDGVADGLNPMVELVRNSAKTLTTLKLQVLSDRRKGYVDGDLLRVISKKCTKLRKLHLDAQKIKDKDISVLFASWKKHNLRDHLVDLEVICWHLDFTWTGLMQLWKGKDVLPFYGLKYLTIRSRTVGIRTLPKAFVASLRSVFKGRHADFTLPSLLRVTLHNYGGFTALSQFSSSGYYQRKEEDGKWSKRSW
eukprot:TRINITY_DN944_c0_g4_i1.p1 TRINITY_DN944_c0_g4~~TRINITY_DN944_c0_g4_i1.p1  ORF type:complete len:367 (-),score=56.72 TRINITY_DN944_c0_g4_i1:22-996(-)